MRKIRNKLMLTMMVLTLLPAVLIGAYSIYTTSEALRETALSAQRNQLTQTKHSIEHHVSGVENDLVFLRDSGALQLYLSAKRSSLKRSSLLLENLRNSTLLFAQQQQIYSSVHLLDRQGREILRIENMDGQAKSLTKKNGLRNLKGQAFFRQASTLKRGQIYISPMELRKDGDNIITPHQPIIRYVTAVADKNGRMQAVLVLNLNGNLVIDNVTENINPAWSLLFTDPDGYYYYNPESSKRWGNPRDLNNASNAFDDTALSLSSLKDATEAKLLESDDNITLSQPISLGEGRPSLG